MIETITISTKKSFFFLKGGTRFGAPGAPPMFVHFWGWGVVFVNFDCLTRIRFHCIQHAVFTISILSSTLATKT